MVRSGPGLKNCDQTEPYEALNDTIKTSNLVSEDYHHALDLSSQPSYTELQSSNNLLQCFLIEGMTSLSPSIKFVQSNKPYFFGHRNISRLSLQLQPVMIRRNHEQQSMLFCNNIYELLLNISSNDYQQTTHGDLDLIVSFGYFYCLHYPKQQQNKNQLPADLETLKNDYFIPYLTDTYLPSTIVHPIEDTAKIQQIFYQVNHTIKPEYYDKSNPIKLKFLWLKMELESQKNETIVICLNQINGHEILIKFDKHGFIKTIIQQPKIWFKYFQYKHQQPYNVENDDDFNSLLYELRSNGVICTSELIFNCSDENIYLKQFNPSHPTTLPLRSELIPILSIDVITNKFTYGNLYHIHVIHKYKLHFLNDNYSKMNCTKDYFINQQQKIQRLVEMHIDINELLKIKNKNDRQCTIKQIWSICQELYEMLNISD
ncbi:unnamed protein product [Didymodactylos carnosus]|uniref:Uncharacterized protein n=1 Tax=Didymodactylos carnosus TaxID=1234261 RepID=A0A8S2F850_9BILA|nr:unnamed protein product [Didymodactylos carnosus]CAF4199782.1 unnamed protein product [Didymodactylos carnosus]